MSPNLNWSQSVWLIKNTFVVAALIWETPQKIAALLASSLTKFDPIF